MWLLLAPANIHTIPHSINSLAGVNLFLKMLA